MIHDQNSQISDKNLAHEIIVKKSPWNFMDVPEKFL